MSAISGTTNGLVSTTIVGNNGSYHTKVKEATVWRVGRLIVGGVPGGGVGYTSSNTRVQLTGNLAVPTATETLIPFDQVDYDPDSAYDTGTSTYTVAADALIEISGSVQVTNADVLSNNPVEIRVKNGGTTIANFAREVAFSSDSSYNITFFLRVEVTAADALRVYINQASGSPATVIGSELSTYLEFRTVQDTA